MLKSKRESLQFILNTFFESDSKHDVSFLPDYLEHVEALSQSEAYELQLLLDNALERVFDTLKDVEEELLKQHNGTV